MQINFKNQKTITKLALALAVTVLVLSLVTLGAHIITIKSIINSDIALYQNAQPMFELLVSYGIQLNTILAGVASILGILVRKQMTRKQRLALIIIPILVVFISIVTAITSIVMVVDLAAGY